MNTNTIAIVLNSQLAKHGSYEDFMIWMAWGARARQWNLHFIFPAIKTPAVAHLIEQQGATVHNLDLPFTSQAGATALSRLLTVIQPQVANFHFCDNPQMLRVYLTCRRRGIRVISHYHGEIRPLHLLRWKNKHFSLLRLLSLLTDQIVTISNANKRFLEALHVMAPVEMIYNGIDTTSFLTKANTTRLRQPVAKDDPIHFLYIGQLIKRKQVPVLIRAFAKVHREFPSARLTVVGGGEEEATCRALAGELQLGECIEFTGLISEYPFAHLQRSDVFVSASESESFGLVFPEAMCLGLPAIACRVGGIPEVIEDKVAGLLVPPYDTDALADAMLKLARSPKLRRQMGEAGRRRAAERFDLSDKVDAVLDVFGQWCPRESPSTIN